MFLFAKNALIGKFVVDEFTILFLQNRIRMTEGRNLRVAAQPLQIRNPFSHAYTRPRDEFEITLPTGQYTIEGAIRNILQQRNIAQEMLKSTKSQDETTRSMLINQIRHLTNVASTLNNAELSAAPSGKRRKTDYAFKIGTNTTKRLTPEEEEELLKKANKIREQFGVATIPLSQSGVKRKNPPLIAEKKKKIDEDDDKDDEGEVITMSTTKRPTSALLRGLEEVDNESLAYERASREASKQNQLRIDEYKKNREMAKQELQEHFARTKNPELRKAFNEEIDVLFDKLQQHPNQIPLKGIRPGENKVFFDSNATEEEWMKSLLKYQAKTEIYSDVFALDIFANLVSDFIKMNAEVIERRKKLDQMRDSIAQKLHNAAERTKKVIF